MTLCTQLRFGESRITRNLRFPNVCIRGSQRTKEEDDTIFKQSLLLPVKMQTDEYTHLVA